MGGMRGKVILVLAAAAIIVAYAYFFGAAEAPVPEVGNIEFENADANIYSAFLGQVAYREGDKINVKFEIALPEGLKAGAKYNVHEEFFNAWDDASYGEYDWQLDPAEYPEHRVEIRRSYETAGLAPTEIEVAEYAIYVVISEPETGREIAVQTASVYLEG